MPPASVNFNALPSRLSTIWRSPSASSATVGAGSGVQSSLRDNPLRSASGRIASSAWAQSWPTSQGTTWGLKLPLARRENASERSSSPRSAWPAARAAASRSCSLLDRRDWLSRSIEASIVCAELRTSWLIIPAARPRRCSVRPIRQRSACQNMVRPMSIAATYSSQGRCRARTRSSALSTGAGSICCAHNASRPACSSSVMSCSAWSMRVSSCWSSRRTSRCRSAEKSLSNG